MTLEEKRYVDPGTPLGAYARTALAVCPACGGPALVRSPTRYVLPFLPRKARVHCLSCSFVREQEDAAWFGPVVGHARRRCPTCGFRWLRATECRAEWSPRQRQSARMECPACHETAELPFTWYRDAFSGEAVDPTFGLPLWLQAPCRGHTLWAYNEEHLRALRAYVAAAHRERHPDGKWSMVARLPQWIKSAKSRDDVLRCLDRLEERLREAERA